MDTTHTYDQLAEYYHLIFENWEAAIERQAAALSAIVQQCGLARNACILDCACGIGTQSLGLARLGYRVTGCDASPEAVKRARQEASRRSLDIPFSVTNMLDLADLPGSEFDAIICMDNSLPHLENAQLQQTAKQIRKKLRPGGLFMASIRDYDRLIEERPLVQGPSFYSDQGRRRIVHQVWDWLDDRRYIFHIYITRELQGWQTFHTCAVYHAIRRDELSATLSQAGFKNVRWLLPSETGFFQPIVLAE